MGCGCGRNKSSGDRAKRIARLKQMRTNKILASRTKAKAPSPNLSSPPSKSLISDPLEKEPVCKACPYGTQTAREKKAGIFVCHKTNRLIKNLILDEKFNCPINRWIK
jgi:hypothetical protein